MWRGGLKWGGRVTYNLATPTCRSKSENSPNLNIAHHISIPGLLTDRRDLLPPSSNYSSLGFTWLRSCLIWELHAEEIVIFPGDAFILQGESSSGCLRPAYRLIWELHAEEIVMFSGDAFILQEESSSGCLRPAYHLPLGYRKP